MLPLTRAVCVCFVQHLTDRRQKCVGPLGSFTSLTQWPSGPTKRHQSAERILMPSPLTHTHSSLYLQDLQYEEYGGKKFCLSQFINVLHADRTSRTRCVEYQNLVLLNWLYIRNLGRTRLTVSILYAKLTTSLHHHSAHPALCKKAGISITYQNELTPFKPPSTNDI